MEVVCDVADLVGPSRPASGPVSGGHVKIVVVVSTRVGKVVIGRW